MTDAQVRISVWLLVLLHLASSCAIIGWGPQRDTELWFAACIGLFAAQDSLLAMWVALGGGAVVVRLLVSLLGLGAIAWACGYIERGQTNQFWLLFFLFGAAALIVSAPFGVLRLRNSRLTRVTTDVSTGAMREALRFSIRDLWLWTLAVAVALGVFRWVMSVIPTQSGRQGDLWIIFAFGATFAAVALVAAWAALSARIAPLRIAAFLVVATLGGLAPCVLVGLNSQPELYVAMTVAQGVVVLATLLALRAMGYRLVRPEPTPVVTVSV